MEKQNKKIGTIELDKLVRVLKDHLDECDLDELFYFAGEISGARLFGSEDDLEMADIFIEEDGGGNYFGMFDEVMKKV